jgi:hypothetical protein
VAARAGELIAAPNRYMDRGDPYFVLLRRELTRAQARLRRCERERDALRDALDARPGRAGRARQTHDGKPRRRARISKQSRGQAKD